MKTPFTLAHFSDVHLSPITGFGPRYWNAKRTLGLLNWQRGRKHVHERSVADRLMADAIALRTLHGALRATYLDAKDSIRWQQTIDRAFMTTAGEAYGSVSYKMKDDGLLLLFNHSPGGLNAINSTYGEEDVKKKKDKSPTVEPSEVHSAWISSDGKPAIERTLGKPEKGSTLCPMTTVIGADGAKAWFKGYDRVAQHQFVEFSPSSLSTK